MAVKFLLGETLKIADELQCCYRFDRVKPYSKLSIKQKTKTQSQIKIAFTRPKQDQKFYYRYIRLLNNILEEESGDRIFSLDSVPKIIPDEWNIQFLQITLHIDLPDPDGDYSLELTEIDIEKRKRQVLLNHEHLQFKGCHQLQLGTERIILEFTHVLEVRSETAVFEIYVDNLGCYSNQLTLEIGDKIQTLIELFQSPDPLEFAEKNKDSLNELYPNLIFQNVKVEIFNLEQKMQDTLFRIEQIIPQIKKQQTLLLDKPVMPNLVSSNHEQIRQSQFSPRPLQQSISFSSVKLPPVYQQNSARNEYKKSQQYQKSESHGKLTTEAQAEDYSQTLEAYQHKINYQAEKIKQYEETLIQLKNKVEKQEEDQNMHDFLSSSLKDDMNRILDNLDNTTKPVLKQQLSMQIQKIQQVEAQKKQQKQNLHSLVDLLNKSIKNNKEEDLSKESVEQIKKKLRDNKQKQEEVYKNLDRIVKEIEDDKTRIKQFLKVSTMKKSMQQEIHRSSNKAQSFRRTETTQPQ